MTHQAYEIKAILTNGQTFNYSVSAKANYSDRQLKSFGYSVGLPSGTSIARLAKVTLVSRAKTPQLQAA